MHFILFTYRIRKKDHEKIRFTDYGSIHIDHDVTEFENKENPASGKL